jgi:phosphotransferase system HPr (HPr) family protein
MDRSSAVSEKTFNVLADDPPGASDLRVRAFMIFIDLATRFKAQITVQKDAYTADAKSPMEMMLLDLPRGTTITIRAEGSDAPTAVAALCEFLQCQNLDEMYLLADRYTARGRLK